VHFEVPRCWPLLCVLLKHVHIKQIFTNWYRQSLNSFAQHCFLTLLSRAFPFSVNQSHFTALPFLCKWTSVARLSCIMYHTCNFPIPSCSFTYCSITYCIACRWLKSGFMTARAHKCQSSINLEAVNQFFENIRKIFSERQNHMIWSDVRLMAKRVKNSSLLNYFSLIDQRTLGKSNWKAKLCHKSWTLFSRKLTIVLFKSVARTFSLRD